MNFRKLNPNVAHYGRYNKLINELLRGSLNSELSNSELSNTEISPNKNSFNSLLITCAAVKKKQICFSKCKNVKNVYELKIHHL